MAAPSANSQSMIRLLMSFVETRVAYVAAKLGIVDEIEDIGSTASEIAQKLQVSEDALFRVMRTLASLGILHQDENDRFFVTDFGETLKGDSANSVRDYALYCHEFIYDGFSDVMKAVRTGKPIIDDTFQYLRDNPELEAVFHAGQGNRGRIEIAGIIDAFDFDGYKKIVDVGGGNGALLSSILARHQGAAGILIDQASAIEAAKAGRGGPLPRCDLVVGDFFEEVVSGGDLYILKRVLVDWTDEKAVQILKTCRRVMESGIRLLIIEPLIAERNERSSAYLYDMNYLVFQTGRVRTFDQNSGLLNQTGYRAERIIPTTSDLSILEAVAA